MPLIKGSSRKAVSSNIKAELAAGKPRDQAIAIALDVARRAKRASGGGVDDEDMPVVPRVSDPTDRVLSGEVLEPMNSRERNRVARKAMYGREPVLTPEDRAEIGARLPAYEETARGVEEGIGGLAAEATGVPSMYRGAQGVGRGIEEGDPLRAFAGAGEFALGAIPMAGAMKAGRAAIAPFMETAPRAAATFGALTTPSAIVSNADARDKSMAEAVLNDPTVKALEAKRRDVTARLDAANKAHAKSGRITHETAIAPYMNELKTLDGTPEKPGLIEQAKEAARKAYIENAPFRERYPGMAGTMMGVGAGYAAGVPYVKELLKRGADRFVKAPAVEAAAERFGETVGRNKTSEAAVAQQALRNKLDSWDRSHGAVPTTMDAVGNATKGAVAMMEASSIPEQIDYFNFEPGHESHDRAAKLFRDPEYYKERVAPALLGGALGVTGQTIGKMGARKYDFADERALADLGGRGTPRDRFMEGLGLEDRSAKNVERLRAYETQTSPKALRDKDRQRQLADESRRLGDANQTGAGARQLADEAAALEAGAGTGPMGSRPASGGVAPETDRLLADIRDLTQGRAPGSGSSSNLPPVETTSSTPGTKAITNDGPKPIKSPSLSPKALSDLRSNFHAALKTDDLADITLDSLRQSGNLPKMKWSPEQIDMAKEVLDNWKRGYRQLSERHNVEPSTVAQIIENAPKRASGGQVEPREHHSHFQPRKVGRFAGGPVYQGAKDSPKLERKAKGVDVDAALATARKYAHGGAVHAGPVPGETTGRSDKLPIDVESGSYVVPADVVSALGDGNSEAGYANLNKTFGQSAPRLARGGAAVPIKISHGEYVVPPETVARIGKGDMEMGHRTLDKFVLGVRKQNIHKLSKLPPPAR